MQVNIGNRDFFQEWSLSDKEIWKIISAIAYIWNLIFLPRFLFFVPLFYFHTEVH